MVADGHARVPGGGIAVPVPGATTSVDLIKSGTTVPVPGGVESAGGAAAATG